MHQFFTPFLLNFSEISTYLSDITVAREDIIHVGDFNLHLGLPNATGVKEFTHLLAENHLVQHVTKHTHRAGHTLDLIITRSDSSLVSATDVFNSSISDHSSVIFNLETAKPSHVKQREQVQDFRRMDQECFEADLSMARREINLKPDTNYLLLAYTKAVSNTINKYAPVKSRVRTSKGREPWFTDDIHHARKLRRVNEKRWRGSRLEVHRQIYEQHSAEVNRLITRAKQRYFEKKLRSRNQKACFSVLDQLLKSSATKLPSTTSTESLCNQFSSFFTEKKQLIRKKIGGQSATHQADTTVISASPVSNTLSQLRATTEEELGKIIRRCPSKTCCIDPIPTDLPQETLNTHLPYLVSLVNTSFSEGQFLKSLKTAIVKPLLKKDNRLLLKSYRPVSNIPFVSKVMEKVAVSRLIEHLDQNNLHEEHQSAYKALHSTKTALLRVHNDISHALDDKKAVLFVMLDLSAAFDTIDQNQLLDVMEADFGITEKALTWFKTYLKGRTQQVKINSEKSNRVHLQCGVPQGSVLGPVMFVLVTTPLQKILKKHDVYYHKYADDNYCMPSSTQPSLETERELSPAWRHVSRISGSGWLSGG